MPAMTDHDALMKEVSRVVGEVAGAVSLCWEPRPDGEFDSTQAATYVDGAIARLSSVLSAEEARVRADERSKVVAEYATWGPTVAMYTAEQVEENVEQARVEIAQWQTIANAIQTERDELIAEVAALQVFAQDGNEAFASGRREVLADLRAKVEALRDEADEMRGEDDDPLYEAQVLAHDAVLALIEEAQP